MPRSITLRVAGNNPLGRRSGRAVNPRGQRTAQREGASFQSRAMSDAYRCGLNVFEIPNGCKWLPSQGGPPRAVAVKTPFDIGGVVPWQGGRGIFFDAKRAGPNDATTGFQLSRAEPHQLNNLEALGQGGAIAGLLVEAGPAGDVRWLDWRHFRQIGNIVRWDAYEKWHILNAIGSDIDFRALTAMLA